MAAYNGLCSKIYVFCMIFVILLSLLGMGIAEDEGNGLRSPESRNSNLMENVYVSQNHVVVTTSYDISNYQIFKSDYTTFMNHFSDDNNNGNGRTLPYSIGNIKRVPNIVEIQHSDLTFSFDLSDDYDLLILYPSNNNGLRMIYFENIDSRTNYHQPVVGWANDGDFVSYYIQGYSDLFYRAIAEDMKDKDAVYVFENYHLRSYSWFEYDSDIIQPIPKENEIFKEFNVTFDITDSEQPIIINSVYICDSFDDYLDKSMDLSEVFESLLCQHDVWEAQIADSRSSFKIFDIFESGSNDHFKSVNSKHLSEYMEKGKYSEIFFKFYPEKYEKGVASFTFIDKNIKDEMSFRIAVPATRGEIVVPVQSSEKSPFNPFSALESLIFPEDFMEEGGESILDGVFVLIDEKDPENFSHMFDDDSQL